MRFEARLETEGRRYPLSETPFGFPPEGGVKPPRLEFVNFTGDQSHTWTSSPLLSTVSV
jgi:hypothetical protein